MYSHRPIRSCGGKTRTWLEGQLLCCSRSIDRYKMYVSQLMKPMIDCLSSRGMSISIGGFSKAVHEDRLYKSRFHISVHPNSYMPSIVSTSNATCVVLLGAWGVDGPPGATGVLSGRGGRKRGPRTRSNFEVIHLIQGCHCALLQRLCKMLKSQTLNP